MIHVAKSRHKGKEITRNFKSLCYKTRMSTQDIQNLQETVAHQEQQIIDLSDMIIAQGRAIDALKKEVLKLQGKMEQMDEGGAQAANQKPPHY